jgi:creatinine amidohydrolase
MNTPFWNRLTAPVLVEMARNDAVVLLPVASTEQHGPHLATGTDDILCTEVCRRAAHIIGRELKVVVAPTVWMGLAEHHVAFGGSFTVSLKTWHALLHDLCEAILRAGFRKILIVNSHGGNTSALNALTVEITRSLNAPIATTNYVSFIQDALAETLEDQDGLQHACEAETSMILALDQALVDAARIPEAFGPHATHASALGRQVHVSKSFRTLTDSGVLGDARRANAEKGEYLLNAAASGIANAVVNGKIWDGYLG